MARASAGEYVAEDESISFHDLTEFDLDWRREAGTVEGKRMELSALTARIDTGRKFFEKFRVECSTDERRGQLLRIDARDDCPYTVGHDSSCERPCRKTPP